MPSPFRCELTFSDTHTEYPIGFVLLNIFTNAEFCECVGQNSSSAFMCLNTESRSCVGAEEVLLMGVGVIVAGTSGANRFLALIQSFALCITLPFSAATAFTRSSIVMPTPSRTLTWA